MSTKLIKAVVSNKIKLLRKCIKLGYDVNFQDPVHWNTALNYALQNKNYEIAIELLKSGADPMIKNKLGITAKHIFYNRVKKGAKNKKTYKIKNNRVTCIKAAKVPV